MIQSTRHTKLDIMTTPCHKEESRELAVSTRLSELLSQGRIRSHSLLSDNCNSIGNQTPQILLGVESYAPCHPRWNNIKVANLAESRSIHHRFVIKTEMFDVQLYHHPMEVYLTWDLHKREHYYENLGPHTSSQQLHLPGTEGVAFLRFNDHQLVQRTKDPTLMVVRPGSPIFDECFPPEHFRYPILPLIHFLIRNGSNDATRSDGWRVNLCNGGEASELDGSTNKWKPRTLCGTSIFETDSEGELVRAIIGRIADATCKAAAMMTQEMGQPHFLNEQRLNEYAIPMQNFLFAEMAFFENVACQLLCLQGGHQGFPHLDEKNDPRPSYNRCFTYVSEIGWNCCFSDVCCVWSNTTLV